MSANLATNRKDVMRDKRAQGIAAMGLVTREGDRFRVATPTLRGRKTSYEVWRDQAGKVRCSCLEFDEQVSQDPTFRCEHILAVKHSLLTKNSEAVSKQQPASQRAANATVASTKAAVPTNNTNAVEEREEQKAEKHEAARSEREQNVAEEEKEAVAAPEISKVRSLAKTRNTEEHEMKRDKALAIQNETEETRMAEPVASVVPLAFTNTLRALKQQVDPSVIKSREGWKDRQGNTHMVDYVEWHAVADILDRIAPTWSHAVRAVTQIGDMVAVTAAITIDGVTREGVGTGTADSEMGIKKAEHDALKRAAVKFGIARELYQRESEVIEKEGAAEQHEFPRDPLAKSMSDLVTPKQLGMIRAIGREIGVDVEEECQQVLRCKTEELSKRAASSFIDHLKNLQSEAGGNQMRRAS
ncbi:MAG: hypothetical protein AUG51_10605 [Acidobacteria bacterium 13_1_20CM_3_53_8]|nr:MAG: hypothetical protein AUG51_10605 [Acidobacteria bacterium 13_1_20CM_3_53_8]